MATTFEQLKAAANMLQAAMASEDEKTRADALSVMYAVGRTGAPTSGASGQQHGAAISGTDKVAVAGVARVGHEHFVAGLDEPWGQVQACTSCGKCVDVCPTGALFRKQDATAEKQPHPERAQQLAEARTDRRWHNQ